MKPRAFILLTILSAYTLMHVHSLTSAETKSKPAAAKPKPVGKQTASQLLADAKKALAYTVKAARAAGKELSASNPDAKPFLLSLQKVGKSLDSAEKALAAKDPAFFQSISHAQAAVIEMQVAWDLTKSKDADVIKGGKALGGAVTALHDEFGPMAQRKAKGGELTDTEKTNFEKLKSSQAEFRKKLHHLFAKNKKDPALEVGLRKLNKRSLEIEKAPNTVTAYVGAMDFLSTISGLLHGYAYYVPAAERKAWKRLAKSSGAKQSYYYSPGATYNWSTMESSVEVYDSYDLAISSEEVTSEENYIDETSFEMTEQESEEVAEDSDSISEEAADDDEMQSEQEDVDDSEDDEDMGAEDDGGDESSDEEMGGDESDDGGDDGGGDDGGGDDGGDE